MEPAESYSTIRRAPKHKPAGDYSMDSFYAGLLKPHALFLSASGYIALANRNFLEILHQASTGDSASILHVLLLVLSIVTGVRLIQSLYLARRDYPHLESGILDVFIFFAVVLFTSGVVLASFDVQQIPVVGKLLPGFLTSQKQFIVMCVYAFCAFVGV
ncbi:MAG TPA: hypothetical protein VHO24_03315, partial [Opitutaceae bacterium]|nr:hypothetical protein [Opitutaceae bacterium]